MSLPINEPWEPREEHLQPVIYDCKGFRVFPTNLYARDRIVACVNACRGLSDETLQDVIDGKATIGAVRLIQGGIQVVHPIGR